MTNETMHVSLVFQVSGCCHRRITAAPSLRFTRPCCLVSSAPLTEKHFQTLGEYEMLWHSLEPQFKLYGESYLSSKGEFLLGCFGLSTIACYLLLQ